MSGLTEIDEWPVDNVAAAVIRHGSVVTRGDIHRPFPLASITKLITSLAVLVACEEESTSLDTVVTESGATVSDLLCHAGGIAPDRPGVIAEPRTRRSYSTASFQMLADHIANRSGIEFATYLREAVLEPAGMSSTTLEGSPGAGAVGAVTDMIRLARCWCEPMLLSEETLHLATTAQLPDLAGVLPGFGRQDPNPWGLGPEIRGIKRPHWTSPLNSKSTFGHFGSSGTMLWIDPEADTTLVALADREFGPWAVAAWPRLSTAVLDA